MLDNREIMVGAVGFNPTITKQPNDKFIINVNFREWLDGRTTVASVGSVTFAGTGTAPTGVAGTVASPIVPITLDAGTNGYIGTMTFTATMTNAEKKEVEIKILVIDNV
jgi:hypothetical protein